MLDKKQRKRDFRIILIMGFMIMIAFFLNSKKCVISDKETLNVGPAYHRYKLELEIRSCLIGEEKQYSNCSCRQLGY